MRICRSPQKLIVSSNPKNIFGPQIANCHICGRSKNKNKKFNPQICRFTISRTFLRTAHLCLQYIYRYILHTYVHRIYIFTCNTWISMEFHNWALKALDGERIRNTRDDCGHIWHRLNSPLILHYKKGDGLGGYYFVTSFHWNASNFVTPQKKGIRQRKKIFLKYISSIQEFRWIFHGNSCPVTCLLVGVFKGIVWSFQN